VQGGAELAAARRHRRVADAHEVGRRGVHAQHDDALRGRTARLYHLLVRVADPWVRQLLDLGPVAALDQAQVDRVFKDVGDVGAVCLEGSRSRQFRTNYLFRVTALDALKGFPGDAEVLQLVTKEKLPDALDARISLGH